MKKTLCAAFIYELFCNSILGLHATQQKLDEVNQCINESGAQTTFNDETLYFCDLDSKTNDEFKECVNEFFDVELADSDVDFLKGCASIGSCEKLEDRRFYRLLKKYDSENKTIQSYFLNKAREKILDLKKSELLSFSGNFDPTAENFLQDLTAVNIVMPLTTGEREFIHPLLNQASAIREKLESLGFKTKEIKKIIDDIYSPLEISFYEEVGFKKERETVNLEAISEKIKLEEAGNKYGISEINALTVSSYLEGLKTQGIIREEQKQEYLNLIKKENIENLKERYKKLLSTLKYKRRISFENTNILLSLSVNAKKQYIENILKHLNLAVADEQARKVLVVFLAKNENVDEEEKTLLVRSTYLNFEDIDNQGTSFRIGYMPSVRFCGKMADLFYDDREVDLYKIEKTDVGATSAKDKFAINKQLEDGKLYWILIHELRHVNSGTLVNYCHPSIFDSLYQYFHNKFISELFFPNFFNDALRRDYGLFFAGMLDGITGCYNEIKKRNRKINKSFGSIPPLGVDFDKKSIENIKNECEKLCGELCDLEQKLRISVDWLLAVWHFGTQIGYVDEQNNIKLIGKEKTYNWEEFLSDHIELLASIYLIEECFGWYPDIEELRNVTGVLYLNGRLYIDDLNDNNLCSRWFYSKPLVIRQGDEEALERYVTPVFKDYVKKIDKNKAYEVFYDAFSFLLDLKTRVKQLDDEQRGGN